MEKGRAYYQHPMGLNQLISSLEPPRADLRGGRITCRILATKARGVCFQASRGGTINVITQSSRPAVDVICLQLRPVPWALLVTCVIALLAFSPQEGHAQTVTTTVPVGTAPLVVAATFIANSMYTVKYNTNKHIMIDGVTNSIKTATQVAASMRLWL